MNLTFLFIKACGTSPCTILWASLKIQKEQLCKRKELQNKLEQKFLEDAPFRDGSLSNSGLSYEDRIILCSSGQDLNASPNLIISSNNWI